MNNFIEYLYAKFLQSDGVSIDTRTVQPDNLFFAIKGPNFNGNQYAKQALDKGAAFAVVDEREYADDPRIILAPDAMKALQDLAVFHRSRYKRKLLAITGSNGKTTTKELISRVLSKKYTVHATIGNYNNHLGVPLTLLHIHPQVEVAVIEMGANHIGEISELCSYAQPNYGLITNIGEAHTETFGGIEGVMRGKSELLDHLRKSGGTPFINSDDSRLANMAKRFDEPVLFPVDDLKLVSANPFLVISLQGTQLTTHLIGRYNFGNVAAAIAVGRSFGVDDEDILDAIGNYVPSNQRSQLIRKGSVSIINDSYNANPTSMKAAIDNLALVPGKKVVILGQMNEVENPEERHRELGSLIMDAAIDQVYLVGKYMKHAHEVATASHWFEEIDDLKQYLKAEKPENCTILLKASRSMKMETLLDLL